jgi:hypothetical protein
MHKPFHVLVKKVVHILRQEGEKRVHKGEEKIYFLTTKKYEI